MNEEEQTLEGLDFLAPEVEEPVQPVKMLVLFSLLLSDTNLVIAP